MASSRTPLFVILPALGIVGCSLFTSLDGLNGGDDAGSATDASSAATPADRIGEHADQESTLNSRTIRT